MTNVEIRIKITENNKKIEDALRKFVLTDEIRNYMAENDKLRELCTHKFKDGICIYCDLPEEYKND